MQKDKVIVICGPTASGKTALSIELAKQINGEIVSCDSMQIYKDMNIGTAKPTEEEQKGIKHYLIDFVSPDERYSVADYKQDAKKAIKEILKKGKVPIVVGGTGLYIDSLIYEIEYPNIEFDEKYRKELEIDSCKKSGKFFRMYNEFPTMLAILIVGYVITKTFSILFTLIIVLLFVYISYVIMKPKTEKKL